MTSRPRVSSVSGPNFTPVAQLLGNRHEGRCPDCDIPCFLCGPLTSAPLLSFENFQRRTYSVLVKGHLECEFQAPQAHMNTEPDPSWWDMSRSIVSRQQSSAVAPAGQSPSPSMLLWPWNLRLCGRPCHCLPIRCL